MQRKLRYGIRWTVEERAQLHHLRKVQRLTVAEIATRLRRTPFGVTEQLHSQGIKLGPRSRRMTLTEETRVRALLADKVAVSRIAKELRCCEKTLRRWLQDIEVKASRQIRIPDSAKARIKRLWIKHALSTGKIADRVGCTRNVVVGQLYRMGLLGKQRLGARV